MLFLELALIRWIGANDVYVAFLANLVLLASFLGIGIGFLRAGRTPSLLPWAPVALALLVAFLLAFPVKLERVRGPNAWQGAFGFGAIPRSLSLGVIFLLTVAVMACIGHGVGEAFRRFRPLESYRLDILGSIGGVAAFTLLSFLRLPPIAWGGVASALFVVLIGPRWQLVGIAAVVGLLVFESLLPHDHWSPYYKVTAVYSPEKNVLHHEVHGVLKVWANDIPHQTAYPVSTLRWFEPFYFFPYRHVDRSSLDDVLIVGAGTGNDVAVALSEGAKRIDAVEIDPVIQRLGSRYHPDHPYQDPRVHVHIDDGRAFIERTDRHYDLILFALPDSLTLIAGQGSLRLENYLFTIESMRTVRGLLKPGGTFAMYNYYQSFLLDRYAGTLDTVYGRAPCVELGQGDAVRRQAVLTESLGPARGCTTTWHGTREEAPTDDHPFPYLRHRAIAPFYWRTLLLMLLASILLIAGASGGVAGFRGMRRYVDLAFMGGAFLLLETKNVVQFALLFGTTWVVNSLVFAGVLLSVYAAIEAARHVRLPRPRVLYVALLGALALSWAIAPASLLSLAPVWRFLAAGSLAFAPIFLANLVFAQRFRETASATTAFAANLLGAMVGGMLEYLSLITGYRALLLVVAGLYGLAFLTTPRRATEAVRVEAPAVAA